MSRWRIKLSERDEGFTLVELVVAMFILAIVLVSLMAVQLSAMITITDATRRQQATAYANEAMETLRAMPWDTLNKGNVPGFHTAGGNSDPYFTGNNAAGTVSVDGATYTVRFATTNTQNLAVPRTPLFDSSGSNRMVLSDPEKPDVTFNVRGYIVDSLDGSAGSVGLLVIVSWVDAKGGDRKEIALRSSAYPGSSGCGDLAVQPYLVSCQDRFTFGGASGYVTTSLTATEPDSSNVASLVDGESLKELSVRSAYVTSNGESVQVSSVEGKVSRGGVTRVALPVAPSSTAVSVTNGYSEIATAASDNFSVSGGPTPDQLVTVGAGPSSSTSVSSGNVAIGGRGDDGRTGSSRSSTTQACNGTQLFAGSPCTYTSLTGTAQVSATQSSSGQTMYSVLRSGTTDSTSGGGRFIATPPGAMFGCQTLGSSGCTSARSTYEENQLRFGTFTSGSWVGGAQYLVQISTYKDSVLTQRGALQQSTAATITRTAGIRVWNGTAYSANIPLTATSSGAIAQSGTVTWNPGGGVTVTASASVSATPVSAQVLGENPVVDCSTDACATTATAGSVTVNLRYQVVTPTASWDIYQSSILTGSAASASYERRS